MMQIPQLFSIFVNIGKNERGERWGGGKGEDVK